MIARKLLVIGLAAVSAGLLFGSAAAQRGPGKTGKSIDQMFVTKAAEAGMSEVREGEIASKKDVNEAVKQAARRLVDDHTKANDELKRIAGDKNFVVPAEPTSMQRAFADKLENMNGRDFEWNYVRDQRSAHLQAIKLFESEMKNGRDPELKSFASKTLPTLKEHYKILQAIKVQPKSIAPRS